MNQDRFARLLTEHGSDFSRWPPALARQAEALCFRAPEAARLWRASVRLDALMARERGVERGQAPVSTTIDGALRRIRAQGQAERFWTGWGWPGRSAMGAAVAASLLLGWVVGAELPGVPEPPATAALSVLLSPEAATLLEDAP